MDTRIRILKEAGILFGKMGIRAVTMDNISQELGVSKRTIYELFSDKDDLIEQAILEGLKLQKRVMNDEIDKAENVIVAIIGFITNHQKMFQKINPLFFYDLKKYHSRVFRKINEKGELRDYSISRKLLDNGVREGIFISELNIELANRFFHEVMDYCKPDGEVAATHNTDDIRRTIFIPYLRGICTNKGLTILNDSDFFKKIDL